jgi:hypothetical protein
MTEVLEHLKFHPLYTMQKIRSLLNPKGRFYLSTPDAAEWGRTKYYSNLADMPCLTGTGSSHSGDTCYADHVYHFDKTELFELAQAAGFKVNRCAYSLGAKSRHLNLTSTRA